MAGREQLWRVNLSNYVRMVGYQFQSQVIACGVGRTKKLAEIGADVSTFTVIRHRIP
jgi:hypothetical protein